MGHGSTNALTRKPGNSGIIYTNAPILGDLVMFHHNRIVLYQEVMWETGTQTIQF